MEGRAARLQRAGDRAGDFHVVGDGQDIVGRVIGLAVGQQAALVRSGDELHGAHLGGHVVHGQPHAQRMVVELGLPIGMVLVPERGAAAGRLADHVSPAGQPVLVDPQERRGIPLGVAPEGRVENLRELHLREEGLGELRLFAGIERARTVHRRAGLAGLLRVEDVLENLTQPGDLFVSGQPLDDEEAVLLEELHVIAGGRGLERRDGRGTEPECAHTNMLA